MGGYTLGGGKGLPERGDFLGGGREGGTYRRPGLELGGCRTGFLPCVFSTDMKIETGGTRFSKVDRIGFP